MNPEDLRVIKTKMNLEAALIELLKHKPLEKITVSELCRLSGITRKTFYLHYENVPKYFEEFIEHLLNELEEAMKKTTNHRQISHQLEPKMIHLFEHVYANKEFYQFIFSSNSNFAYYEMFFKRIKEHVKEAVTKLDVGKEISEFEVSFQTNAILGVIMEWYYEGFQTPVDEMNLILLKVFRINESK